MRHILAADIGGTNSRFGHFQDDDQDGLALLQTCWLATNSVRSFGELLRQLPADGFSLTADQADAMVIAVAGPLEHGMSAAPPYIPWDIDLAAPDLRKMAPNAKLINDFVAQAYACVSPVGCTAVQILSGEPEIDGVIGVLGGGTALGKALLVPGAEAEFQAWPSEGGHALFPFCTEQEMRFHEFYRERGGFSEITGNLVISGRGMRFVHWFLTGDDLEPPEVAARLTMESETLAWLARFHGRACRGFALEILARGGLFIAGGVAGRNPQILGHEQFRAEFLHSATMGHVLENIPVHLLDDQDSGLWGAAFHGWQILEGKTSHNRA